MVGVIVIYCGTIGTGMFSAFGVEQHIALGTSDSLGTYDALKRVKL